MTDPFSSAPNSSAHRADDMVEGDHSPSADLDRAADLLLRDAEGRAFQARDTAAPTTARGGPGRPASVRQAIKDDLAEGRDWSRRRTALTRDAVRDHPIKTTAYAIGAGVLLGLLIAR